jgi:hypothetical protein
LSGPSVILDRDKEIGEAEMHKEVREIARKLEEQGWEIRTGNQGYEFAYPPDKSKRPVKLPSTPGGKRWKQNLIGALRRNGAKL